MLCTLIYQQIKITTINLNHHSTQFLNKLEYGRKNISTTRRDQVVTGKDFLVRRAEFLFKINLMYFQHATV
jgi:hypothetical protein